MNARRLQDLLLATLAATPLASGCSPACGDVAPTKSPPQTYLLSQLDAGTSDGGASDAGTDSACVAACKQATYSDVASCRFVEVTLDGGGTAPGVECVVWYTNYCEGRRPAGLRDARATGEGAHFALASHLEAASVLAFAQLSRELRHHRAPRRLIAAARRSRRDEIRHARMTTALARRRGGVVPRVVSSAPRLRGVEELAIENAIEGCVRETFGALTAWWRAKRAPEPEVRAAYLRIARDETRHAALAWQIDAWASRRLDRAARARVEAARAAAVATLRAELAHSARSSLTPDPAVALGWLGELGRTILGNSAAAREI